MLVLLTKTNKVPDIPLAVLHQIGDVRSLEEGRIQIPIDSEDAVSELDFSYDFDFLLSLFYCNESTLLKTFLPAR